MRPILFEIPGLGIPVFGYGFMIMIAFIAATTYSIWRTKREGRDPNPIIDLGILVVLAGVIGARIFYYIEFYDEHFANRSLLAIVKVWEGGIVFYGGLIAGTAVGIIYCWKKEIDLLRVADVIAPSLALALVFARIGCFLNGCCWGTLCSAEYPLGVVFPKFQDEATLRTIGSPAFLQHHEEYGLALSESHSLPVHPTQLYSALAALLLFLALHFAYRHRKKKGQIFTLFFVAYAVIRIGLEVFRGDNPLYPAGLDGAGWAIAGLAAAGWLGGTALVIRWKKGAFDWRPWLAIFGGSVGLLAVIYGGILLFVPKGLHISQWVGVCLLPAALAGFVYFSLYGTPVEPESSEPSGEVDETDPAVA